MERITFISGVRGGRPTIRGMRITVTDVLEMIANGMSEAEIVEALPLLEPEDVREAARYAAQAIDHPVVTASVAAE